MKRIRYLKEKIIINGKKYSELDEKQKKIVQKDYDMYKAMGFDVDNMTIVIDFEDGMIDFTSKS